MPLLKDQIVLATPNTEEYRSLKGVFPLDKLKKETFVIRESMLELIRQMYRWKIRIQITDIIWIQETIENIENFGLSLDLYYHSPYNNEEYERDMEEEY